MLRFCSWGNGSMNTTCVLSAKALTKTFGSVTALRDVSCRIEAGELVAIMGPSGSGKSTLLHCLSGVLPVDAGEVRVAGQLLSGLSDHKRSHVRLSTFGFIFQDGQLLDELTARENVALPLMLEGTSRHKALARADDVLASLGLGSERTRRPGDMSGGQAQRVAVARALAVSPAVIFADEPTGALDQTTGHEVMQLLTACAHRNGAALVVVTHDPMIARWCHRLIEIRDGRIHADRMIVEEDDQ